MPACDPLQSIMVLICIALHGNRSIPYSHYTEEIQLRLKQGESQTSSILQHTLPSSYIQSLIRVMRYK